MSWHQCDQILQTLWWNLISFSNFMRIWKILNMLSLNYNAFLLNFHCGKWLNFEQTILPSGHTGRHLHDSTIRTNQHLFLISRYLNQTVFYNTFRYDKKGRSMEHISRRIWWLVCAQLPKKLDIVSIGLRIHNHSSLPLGQIRAFISSH